MKSIFTILKETFFNKAAWKLVLELNILIWISTLIIYWVNKDFNLHMEELTPFLGTLNRYIGWAVVIVVFTIFIAMMIALINEYHRNEREK